MKKETVASTGADAPLLSPGEQCLDAGDSLPSAARGVPSSVVELVSTGFETDHRGIPVFTMPPGDPETRRFGTTDLTAFNPEGRVPVLVLPDGRRMTQSGPIMDYLDEVIGADFGRPMMPEDPWRQAEVRASRGLSPRTSSRIRTSPSSSRRSVSGAW